MPARNSAIEFQVAIVGKRVSRLTATAARELVERAIEGEELPAGLEVRIQVWRAGQELDWRADNSRAKTLRASLRRLLRSGRIQLDTLRHSR